MNLIYILSVQTDIVKSLSKKKSVPERIDMQTFTRSIAPKNCFFALQCSWGAADIVKTWAFKHPGSHCNQSIPCILRKCIQVNPSFSAKEKALHLNRCKAFFICVEFYLIPFQEDSA